MPDPDAADLMRRMAFEMMKNAKTEEDEIMRLRGALAHLECHHKLSHSNRVLTSDARVPWHPTGKETNTRNPFPERIGLLRDHPNVEETFEPRLNKESMHMMKNGHSAGKSVTFLSRLQKDLQERDKRRKVRMQSSFRTLWNILISFSNLLPLAVQGSNKFVANE